MDELVNITSGDILEHFNSSKLDGFFFLFSTVDVTNIFSKVSWVCS